MAALIDMLAQETFQILKGSGRSLTLYDIHGSRVYDPKECRRMFAEPDKLMLSITDNGADRTVSMYLSASTELESVQKLINTLRHVATRYNSLFDVRKYGKELSPKDFAYQAEPVKESMWGSAKTSYQRVGSAKLIVRHSARVNETTKGARSRHIHDVFVETASGERFRFPVTRLDGARAFAQHINQGGAAHDAVGVGIVETSQRMHRLVGLRRHIRFLENNEQPQVQQIDTVVRQHVTDSRKLLKRLSGTRGYTEAAEILSAPVGLMETTDDAVVAESQRIADLLNIDQSHALAETLPSVARLTLGDYTMDTFEFNEAATSRVVFEDAAQAADLLETLADEFGLVEGEHFTREDGAFVVSPAVLENIQSYLGEQPGYRITENPTDKFLAYAKSWTAKRVKGAGDTESSSEALEKQAADLAQGLKGIIAGSLPVRLKSQGTPKFTSQAAAVAFKLNALIEPGSGLQNDALWNYVSNLVDKIQHGDALDGNEKFFAARVADFVDKKLTTESLIPEMEEINSWFNQFEASSVLAAPAATVVEADAAEASTIQKIIEEALHNMHGGNVELVANQLDEEVREIAREVSQDVGLMAQSFIEKNFDQFKRMVLTRFDAEHLMSESYGMPGDDPHYVDPKWERAMEQAMDEFNLMDFIHEYGDDFEFHSMSTGQGDDTPWDDQHIKGSISVYFASLAREYLQDSNSEINFDSFDTQVDKLFDTQVKPFLVKHHYTFAEDVAEEQPVMEMDPTVDHGEDAAEQALTDAAEDGISEWIASAPEMSDYSAEEMQSDPQVLEALVQLAVDHGTSMAVRAAEDSVQSWAGDYFRDAQASLNAYAKNAIMKHFGVGAVQEEAPTKAQRGQNQLFIMDIRRVAARAAKETPGDRDAVRARVMDLLGNNMGVSRLIHNDPQVVDRVLDDVMGQSVEECDTLPGHAEQDFQQDVTSGDEDQLQRLRRLAGL